MAKTSTRRVTIFINGKEEEAIWNIFVISRRNVYHNTDILPVDCVRCAPQGAQAR